MRVPRLAPQIAGWLVVTAATGAAVSASGPATDGLGAGVQRALVDAGRSAQLANHATGLLAGRVLDSTNPVAAATVYLYNLADSSLHKASTDTTGAFSFISTPAGLYKMVAFKPGFLPTVVMLTRAAADLRQSVDLELEDESFPGESTQVDFWKIRRDVPRDVLRDIEVAVFANPAEDAGARARYATLASVVEATAPFRTEMAAVAGVDAGSTHATQLTGGKVDIAGALGGYEIGLSGDFRQLAARHIEVGGGGLDEQGTGESRAMTFRLQGPTATSVGVHTFSNSLADTGAGAVDFEHYQVNWTQQIGSHAQSDFSARYTAENNFYRASWMDLVGVPEASRTWAVEGSFTTSFDERTTLQTGLRYRLRENGLAEEGLNLLLAGAGLPQESLDVFARGGTRTDPAVLVEYGLYTTLADGSLSLMPRGGLVFQLGNNWQLATMAGQRLSVEGELGGGRGDFLPTLYDQSADCDLGEEACYQVFLTRQVPDAENGETLSVGVNHRRFADTLRIYFNEDVFNHLESLYLVQGDELTEAQFSVSRELGPRVQATFEGSYAEGGGGELVGVDKQAYENAVRYLLTSVETHFTRTSTGVFVAFHRLEQNLTPRQAGPRSAVNDVAVERLQLLLSQNLNVLLDLSADWAVQLNMELSRGASLASALSDGGLRRQVTGGVSVSF